MMCLITLDLKKTYNKQKFTGKDDNSCFYEKLRLHTNYPRTILTIFRLEIIMESSRNILNIEKGKEKSYIFKKKKNSKAT